MAASTPRSTGDRYRQRWSWDETYWASHCVDCYPGSCPYRVFVKDGKVVFEEVAGSHPVLVEGVPDRNPMGCQKGAAWSRNSRHNISSRCAGVRRVVRHRSADRCATAWANSA